MFGFLRTADKGLADPSSMQAACQKAIHDCNLSDLQDILKKEPLVLNRAFESDKNRTLLHWAVYEGQSQIVQWLLSEKKIQPQPVDYYKQTPLYTAIRFGTPEMVELLLRNGANPNHVDKYGFTPLICAVLSAENRLPQAGPENNETRILKILKCLIAYEAKVELSDKEGETALHHVASRGYCFLLPIFLKSNTLLDVVNHTQDTPLHLAVNNGHTEMVQALLRLGANKELRNHRQLTPYELARQTRQDMSIQLALLVGVGEFSDHVAVGTPDIQIRLHALETLEGLLNTKDSYLQAKRAYEMELVVIDRWPKEELPSFLRLVPRLAKKACEEEYGESAFVDAEGYLKNAIELILAKVPWIEQVHFYENAGKLWLKYNREKAMPYYMSALNVLEEGMLGEENLENLENLEHLALLETLKDSINQLEVESRYQHMKSLIVPYLEKLKVDKKDPLAPYHYLKYLKPLLDYLHYYHSDELKVFYATFKSVINHYTVDLIFDFDQKPDLNILEILRVTVSAFLQHQQLELSADVIKSVLGIKRLPQEVIAVWLELKNRTFEAPHAISVPLIPAKALDYRTQLKSYRDRFKTGLLQGEPILILQAEYTKNISKLLQEIAASSVEWLGEPPCAYAWIGIGSLSTQSLSPYSDVDCALLITESVCREHPYFKAFILTINQIISGLGEPWDWFQGVCTGLHIDGGDLEHLIYSEDHKRPPLLINTPKDLADWVIQQGSQKWELSLMLRKTELKEGKIYLESEGRSLKYTICDSFHQVQGGIISAQDLPSLEGKITDPLSLENMKPLLARIVKIISDRGQTQVKDDRAMLLAFSLLNPCLLYASSTLTSGFKLLAEYQQALANGWQLTETLPSPNPVYRKAALRFWKSLLHPLLTARHSTNLDIKKHYLSPLSYLGTLMALYYGFTNPESRVQTKFPDILVQLKDKKHWHLDYVGCLAKAWEYSLRWRAEVQFKLQDRLALERGMVDRESLRRDSLYPWQVWAQFHTLTDLPFGKSFHPLLASIEDWLKLVETNCSKDEMQIEIVTALLTDGLAAYLSREQKELAVYLHYFARIPEKHRPLFYDFMQNHPPVNPKIVEVLSFYPDENGHCLAVDEEKKSWRRSLNRLVTGDKSAVAVTVEGISIGKGYLRGAVIETLMQEGWVVQEADFVNFNFLKKTGLIQGLNKKSDPAKESALRTSNNVAQGNHLVIPIRYAGQNVHLKVRPDFPGMEIAFSLLIRRVMGEGSPSVELWRWSSGSHHYPVLVSQSVPGELLTDELLSEYSLEAKSYSQLVLMSFLVNPGDGNPGNFLVQRILDEHQRTLLRLVSIDNDRLFAPPFECGHLRVATVLYCFNDMFKTVHPEVRAQLLRLEPYALLRDWLTDLETLNIEHLRLFKKDLATYMDASAMDKQQSYILSMLKEQTIKEVFVKLKTLQHWLSKEPSISHMSLLSKLHPSLANYYREVIQPSTPKKKQEEEKHIKVLSSPIMRFEYAVGNEYRRETVGEIKKYTSTMHMVNYMKLQGRKADDKGKIVEQYQDDFTKARQELEELSTDDAAIEWAKKQSLEGNFKAFGDLPNSYAQEQVIARLYFDKEMINAEGEPDIARQAQWWEHLIRCSKLQVLERVVIRPCQGFSDEHFARLWKRLEKVRQLEIVGCVQLRKSFVSFYSKTLTRLKLTELCVESMSLDMPTLEYLNIPKNQELQYLTLRAPRLLKLNASGDQNLVKMTVDAPLLDEVDFSHCLQLGDAQLKVLVKKCPEIKLMNLEGCDAEKILYKSIKELVPAIAGVEWPVEQMQSLAGIVEDLLANKLDQLNVFEEFSPDKIFSGLAFKAIYLALLRNRSVNFINLSISFMGDEETCLLAQMLEKNSQITSLILFEKNIGDKGVIALANALENNTALEAMLLGPNIGDQGAEALGKALEKNRGLKMIGLIANNTGDRGAIALGKGLGINSSINGFALMGNSIGDRGAEAIAEGLEKSVSIFGFWLLANGVGNRGAAALGRALAKNHHIFGFGLGSNRIQDAGSLSLLKGLKINPNVVMFGLLGSKIGTMAAKEFEEILSAAPEVCLIRENCEVPEGVGTLALPALVHTKEGKLCHFVVKIDFILGSSSLLSIPDPITVKGTTRSLGDEIPLIPETKLPEFLEGHRNTSSLICCTNTEDGLVNKLIIKKGESVRVILIRKELLAHEVLPTASDEALSKQSLFFGWDSAIARIVAKEENLSEAHETLVQELKLLECLAAKNINTTKVPLHDSVMKQMLMMKQGSYPFKLSAVGLVANSIDYKAMEYLAKGLETNRAVRWLVMLGNRIGERRMAVLAKMIERNRDLENLFLMGNSIGDKEIKILADVLEKTQRTKVLEIDLTFNPINISGLLALEQASTVAEFVSCKLISPKGFTKEQKDKLIHRVSLSNEDHEDPDSIVSFGQFCLRNISLISSLLPTVMSMMSSSFIKLVVRLAKGKFNYAAKSKDHVFLANRYAFFARNIEEQSDLLSLSTYPLGSAFSRRSLHAPQKMMPKDDLEQDYRLIWQTQAEYCSRTFDFKSGNLLGPAYFLSAGNQLLKLPGGVDLCADLTPTPPDGDCFFHAVEAAGVQDFSRQSLVRVLLENSSDMGLRDAFSMEILQFLYIGCISVHSDTREHTACLSLMTPDFERYVTELMVAEHCLQEAVGNARLILGNANNTKGLSPLQLLEHLKAANLEYAESFQGLYDQVQKIESCLREYCGQQSVFEAYVREYLEKARGYMPFTRDFSGGELTKTTIDAINQLLNLNIQVYMKDMQSPSQLLLVTQNTQGRSIPIFHDGISHFFGLSIKPKKVLEGAQTPDVVRTNVESDSRKDQSLLWGFRPDFMSQESQSTDQRDLINSTTFGGIVRETRSARDLGGQSEIHSGSKTFLTLSDVVESRAVGLPESTNSQKFIETSKTIISEKKNINRSQVAP